MHLAHQENAEMEALQQKIAGLEKAQWLAQRRMEDIHCIGLLQPLLVNRPVLAFSGSSLRSC